MESLQTSQTRSSDFCVCFTIWKYVERFLDFLSWKQWNLPSITIPRSGRNRFWETKWTKTWQVACERCLHSFRRLEHRKAVFGITLHPPTQSFSPRVRNSLPTMSQLRSWGHYYTNSAGGGRYYRGRGCRGRRHDNVTFAPVPSKLWYHSWTLLNLAGAPIPWDDFTMKQFKLWTSTCLCFWHGCVIRKE